MNKFGIEVYNTSLNTVMETPPDNCIEHYLVRKYNNQLINRFINNIIFGISINKKKII